ncbi:MAG: nucleotide exchange factor GrpE [SAR324 cluster bacterium]|nr:nucleotide exchange factor GrpE [SAR324 cluster bacterium]
MSSLLEAFQAFQDAICIEEIPLPVELEIPQKAPPQSTLDHYTLMEEWIALKQELKNQNKIQHKTQLSLEKVLEIMEAFRPPLESRTVPSPGGTEPQRFNASPSPDPHSPDWKEIFENVLPVLDRLDYAIQYWQEITQVHQNNLSIWLSKKKTCKIMENGYIGLSGIRQRFSEWMETYGVHHYETVNQEFDPATMMAVGQHPVTEEQKLNRVYKEILKGYHYQGKLLRPSEVIVTVKTENSLSE